ncbi:prolyl 3-hydroxylase 1 [Oryzias latipes]|uniref:procollagen-proline 3-dioxygenase n=1 Tax=Oryzias latipes TaxID=8090 RepID=H2MB16_ORYLA|nr:prolyl 3-hydroxylase 1 [Oryzias latipes]
MELRSALFLLCLAAPLCRSDFSSGTPLEPYDFLFDAAVEAYYKADWLSVILNMEKALKNKATVQRVKADCRLSCANQTAYGEPLAGLGVPVPGAGSVEDLGFFQKILKRADCVNSCETEKLGSPTLHLVSQEVELEFKKRTPYNYLQVAYFKINKLDKAVAAANTFFLANPDHVEMKQNLDYYRMMAGVQEEDFRDLEASPHMAEFLLGKKYYSDDSFGLAAAHFEAALDEYFTADKECRVLCEGAYRYDGYNYMEYSADLFQTMTDHYIQALNCKQHCTVELASAPGRDKPFEDFLPSHFNYLQFSYYNSEKYEKAIECAKTYLLFHPDDEVMNQNLNYYSAVLGEDKAKTITARQVVKQHIQHSLLEKELLYFGYEAFGITFVDPDTWTPEDVMPKKLRDKQKAERETAARITEEIGNLMKEIEVLVEEKKKDSTEMAKIIVPQEGGAVLYDDIKVTMTSKQLNGSQRVLLDKVISDDECRELQRLSNAAALKGDGYRGRPSPHTPSETFQGVTVLKAVKFGQEGKVPLKSSRLFFDSSEKVRKVLESYFRLETPLYFSYSHLVCRSAIEEKQEGRTDLSHPVHVDNCVLVSDVNECVKEPPAYTHRDYSAILYLNDDFEGGEFIFTELDAKTVTAEVRPQCGRVVGFGAGKENPHGVRAITKGQRCAVALWFTLNPSHEEKERIQAQELLKMFSTPVNAEFSPQEVNAKSQKVTEESPKVTEESPKVTEESPKVTEDSPKVTKESPKVTEESSKVTGESPKVTEESSKVTGESPKVTEESSKVTEESSKVTEASPKVTEESPKVTEESQKVTEESQKVTKESPKVIEESSKVTGESPKVTEESSKVTEESSKVTEASPKVTEESPKVTEESQKVTEESQKVTKESPKVIEESSKVIEESQKVTEAPPQAQQEQAEKKQNTAPSKQKLDAPADLPNDTAKPAAKTAGKTSAKTKTAPTAQTKAGSPAKAKPAAKVKTATKKDEKQKTQAKQENKKKPKPAAKQTGKASSKKNSASDSQSSKDEL